MNVQRSLEMLEQWSASVSLYLPQILGAIFWLLAGWLVARLLRMVSRRLVETALGRLGRRPSVRRALETSGALGNMPGFAGGLVFWGVLIFFAAAAAETLGLPVITGSLNRFAYYLPNVFAAAVILFAGLVLGSLVSTVAGAAADRAGVARSQLVGSAARVVIVILSAIVALEQLGIDGDVLVIMFAVSLAVLLGTGGLAFGLGARVAVGNIIARHYVALAYRPGEVVRIDGVEGTIVDITATSVLIETEQGRVAQPAQRFLEVMSVLVPTTGAGTSPEGGVS